MGRPGDSPSAVTPSARCPAPVYGRPLTLRMAENLLREHRQTADLRVLQPGARVEREGNIVRVYMAHIRSHQVPDNIEGIMVGDTVYFGGRFNQVIDTNGAGDIERREIRALSNYTFVDDPARMWFQFGVSPILTAKNVTGAAYAGGCERASGRYAGNNNHSDPARPKLRHSANGCRGDHRARCGQSDQKLLRPAGSCGGDSHKAECERAQYRARRVDGIDFAGELPRVLSWCGYGGQRQWKTGAPKAPKLSWPILAAGGGWLFGPIPV